MKSLFSYAGNNKRERVWEQKKMHKRAYDIISAWLCGSKSVRDYVQESIKYESKRESVSKREWKNVWEKDRKNLSEGGNVRLNMWNWDYLEYCSPFWNREIARSD